MAVKRHHRLAYTGIVAGIVLAIGLFAMNFPVFLDDFDQWGWQIKCGTGYATDLAQAAAAAGTKNYVQECESALLMRRLWTMPLAVAGGVAVLVTLVASATASGRESLVRHRDDA
jgi:hypothetical protein